MARRNRGRTIDEEPEHFGDDALPRPPGPQRISKSQRGLDCLSDCLLWLFRIAYRDSLDFLKDVIDEIAKLFPSLFGHHSAVLQPSESNDPASALKIEVVLSGGQPLRGHNVISGMFSKDPNV
ncbi:hypothetical protein Tco_0355391 [Tanacetum coccineum]